MVFGQEASEAREKELSAEVQQLKEAAAAAQEKPAAGSSETPDGDHADGDSLANRIQQLEEENSSLRSELEGHAARLEEAKVPA